MAILATEKVPTLDYWKPAGKLEVGDYVFDKDGKVVKITLVQEYRAKNCYTVALSDHLSVSGDENLAFPTENLKYRNRVASFKNVLKFRRPLRPVKVVQLLEEPLKNKYNNLKYSIQTTKPLQFSHQDLPVPPFIFGYWFFNRQKNKKMTAKSEWILEKFKDHGYKPNAHVWLNYFTVTPTVESHLLPFIPTKIPNNYLFASEEQRIELLSGILMSKTRQYNQKTDTFRFSSKRFAFVQQVQCLTESLGIKTRLMHDETRTTYTLFFRSRIKLIPEQVSPPLKVHQARRYIVDVRPTQTQSCIHLETTGEDNTILVGEGFIPTC